jgi:hypothetical protein
MLQISLVAMTPAAPRARPPPSSAPSCVCSYPIYSASYTAQSSFPLIDLLIAHANFLLRFTSAGTEVANDAHVHSIWCHVVSTWCPGNFGPSAIYFPLKHPLFLCSRYFHESAYNSWFLISSFLRYIQVHTFVLQHKIANDSVSILMYIN